MRTARELLLSIMGKHDFSVPAPAFDELVAALAGSAQPATSNSVDPVGAVLPATDAPVDGLESVPRDQADWVEHACGLYLAWFDNEPPASIGKRIDDLTRLARRHLVETVGVSGESAAQAQPSTTGFDKLLAEFPPSDADRQWLRETLSPLASQAQAPTAPGLSIKQEPKYTTSGHSIVNRASGEPIPADEPVFIFRARDVHAREAMEAYACVLTPGVHRDAVAQRIADFAAFASTHHDRMKEPDTAAQAPTAVQQRPAVVSVPSHLLGRLVAEARYSGDSHRDLEAVLEVEHLLSAHQENKHG